MRFNIYSIKVIIVIIVMDNVHEWFTHVSLNVRSIYYCVRDVHWFTSSHPLEVHSSRWPFLDGNGDRLLFLSFPHDKDHPESIFFHQRIRMVS